MKWAIDQNLGEIYTVDELLDYYPIALQIHRFACPTCGRRVTPVKAIMKEKHFKHKDGSPDCPYYYGGGNGGSYGGISVPKPSFGGVISRDSGEIFEFVGFESFFLSDTKFYYHEELDEIEVKYHPEKHHGNFFLWIKPLEELRLRGFDHAKLINSIITFSKYGRTIVFVINPTISLDRDAVEGPIIRSLVNGSSVVFEIPPLSSLSLELIKVWILDSEGKLICPGRVSLDSLITRTAFSYKKLLKIMGNLESFFSIEPVQVTDPKHTFRSENLPLKISCKNCHYEHDVYVVCTVDFDIDIYIFRNKKNTFIYFRQLRKFQCRMCNKYFYTFEDIEKEWVKVYGEKQLEKKQKKLRKILDIANRENLDKSV